MRKTLFSPCQIAIGEFRHLDSNVYISKVNGFRGELMKRLLTCVFLLVGLIPVATFSSLQDRSVGASPVPELVAVEEDPVDPAARQLDALASRYPDSFLKKRFAANRATRLVLSHHNKPLRIIAFEDGAFEVQLTREFSADDIDGLADHHPELLKYAEAFPRSLKDKTTVNLTIETEVIYRLDNERAFAEEHPELCEIYHAFKTAPVGSVNPALIARLAASGTTR